MNDIVSHIHFIRQTVLRATFWLVLVSSPFLGAHGQVDFSKRSFKAGYDSSNVVFKENCQFYKQALSGHDATRAKFLSEASFSNNIFQGEVDCQREFFPNDIHFDQTAFKGPADFTRDTFTSVASFADTKFQSDCHFVLTTFENYADFSRASFRGTMYFSDLSLTDTTILDFYDAVLADTLDFSATPQIPLEINLSAASLTREDNSWRNAHKHLVFLMGSDISRFRLDYQHFGLLFTDPKTGKEIHEEDIISIYESLLKNFQDRGQLESYQMLDVEFQDYQWRLMPVPIRWLYVVPHYWNGYGHRTGLVFVWTLAFLLLFSLSTSATLTSWSGRYTA